MLDAAGLAALSSVSPDGTYAFSTSSPVLDQIAAGDVLVVGVADLTPHGALRKVGGVAHQDAGVILSTQQATIQEAFEELKVTVKTRLTSGAPPLAPMSGDQQNGLTFPFTLSDSDENGSVALAGSLSLAPSLDLNLDFDVAKFSLKELSLSFGGQETFLAGFTGQGNASIDKSILLGAFEFAPITLTVPTPAGPVPVVLTPRVEVGAGLSGTIHGDVEASVTQDAGFTAGLGYKDGAFGGFSDSDSKFDFEQPSYQAGVNLKALAGPRLEVLVYGAVGPFATVDAYVELGANLEGPPPCATGAVNAGLTAKVGVDFLADYETTLFNKNFPLASFDSCSNDPNAPKPALTWARSLGRAGSTGERAKAVVQLSDGTYVVIGDSDRFNGVSGYAASLWALRLDALGNVMWERAFGRIGLWGLARGVQEVPGGIVIAGSSGIMQLDTGGNLIWAKTYDSGGYLELESIASNGDGTLLVAGRYGDTARAWVAKLDAQGGVLWSHRLGGRDIARIRGTQDGGSILIGSIDTNDSDMLLVRLDGGGQVLWQRALDNRYESNPGKSDGPPTPLSGIDRGNDVVEQPGGGYVAVGESYGSFPIPEPDPAGYYAPWLAVVDGGGALVTSTVYRAPTDALYGSAYAVAARPNGSTLVVGRRADAVSDLLAHEDILLIQGGAFSALGGSGNDAVYVGVNEGSSMPLQLTLDGGAILAATSTSFAGQEQYWLVKLNRTGGINFSYRSQLDGTTYASDKAVSQPVSSAPTEAPLTTHPITSEIQTEVTGAVSLQQAP